LYIAIDEGYLWATCSTPNERGITKQGMNKRRIVIIISNIISTYE